MGFGILVLSGVGLSVFVISQLHMIGTGVRSSVALTGNTTRVLDTARLFEVMRKESPAASGRRAFGA